MYISDEDFDYNDLRDLDHVTNWEYGEFPKNLNINH